LAHRERHCLDVCVLEWCELFADRTGGHYWGRIFPDPTTFLPELLHQIGIEKGDYDAQGRRMRLYRDKFIAHLDSDEVVHLPQLDLPKAAVWFYHAHLGTTDGLVSLAGGFADLDEYYAACADEAMAVYTRYR
jgi:hypothetical protein